MTIHPHKMCPWRRLLKVSLAQVSIRPGELFIAPLKFPTSPEDPRLPPYCTCTIQPHQQTLLPTLRQLANSQPAHAKMPSVKNPNTVSRNRQIARASKARKQALKRLSTAKLTSRLDKADARRGARPGLLPTSGPNRALSKKKQRKLEKQMAHAIRRKAEEEAAEEVEMEGEFSRFTLFPCSLKKW